MKKLLSIMLVVALMATMSVTVFAGSQTTIIEVYMEDSYGDGWNDEACILALSVPDFDDIDGNILGVFTLVDGTYDTQMLTIEKDQTVYFFWVYDENGEYGGSYNNEDSFTIKRGGEVIYTHADNEEEPCTLVNEECFFISEYLGDARTTIIYDVAPTYTVTIPATVELGETTDIKVENVVVNKGKQVEVSLIDANGFKVKTPQGAELTYNVMVGETLIAENDTILTVNPANGKTGSATLNFTTPENIKFAGDYTGTVTFSVSVKAIPKATINFTIDGVAYQAKEDMTWAEWVASGYNTDGFENDGYSINKDDLGIYDADWIRPNDVIIADFDYETEPMWA